MRRRSIERLDRGLGIFGGLALVRDLVLEGAWSVAA